MGPPSVSQKRPVQLSQIVRAHHAFTGRSERCQCMSGKKCPQAELQNSGFLSQIPLCTNSQSFISSPVQVQLIKFLPPFFPTPFFGGASAHCSCSSSARLLLHYHDYPILSSDSLSSSPTVVLHKHWIYLFHPHGTADGHETDMLNKEFIADLHV